MHNLLLGPVRKALLSWPISSAQVWWTASVSYKRVIWWKNTGKLEKLGIISKRSAFFCLKLGPSSQSGFLLSCLTIHLYGACMAWIFWLEWKLWKPATREPIILSKVAWFHLFFIGGTACRGHVSLYHTISARHPWCHLSLDWYHRAAAPPSPGQVLVLNCSQLGAGAQFSIRNAVMRCMRWMCSPCKTVCSFLFYLSTTGQCQDSPSFHWSIPQIDYFNHYYEHYPFCVFGSK